MSGNESILPTPAEWRQLMRDHESEAGQTAMRESIRVAQAADASGRSIFGQKYYERTGVEWSARADEPAEGRAR